MADDLQQVILDELRALRNDIQPRLRKVEEKQANLDGKMTVTGVFCTAIGSVIALVINLFRS